MSSTASATLATWFKIHGVNYSISSACSTSAHCIGNGYELIQWGKQDMVFAGGHEDLDWTMSDLFDAMGPCPPSSTTGHRWRSAPMTPIATVSSLPAAPACWFWKSSSMQGRAAPRSTPRSSLWRDLGRYDMVAPLAKAPFAACAGARDRHFAGRLHQRARHLDAGRRSREMGAIREVFGEKMPYITSTKSLTAIRWAAPACRNRSTRS